MSPVHGIRGATTADENTREAILSATAELLTQLVAANSFVPEDLACAFFTVTPDLTAAFPGEAARVRLGWSDGAFLSATEIPVPDAPGRCIRVLLLVNAQQQPTARPRHIYLKGAQGLRSRGLEGGPPGGFHAQ